MPIQWLQQNSIGHFTWDNATWPEDPAQQPSEPTIDYSPSNYLEPFFAATALPLTSEDPVAEFGLNVTIALYSLISKHDWGLSLSPLSSESSLDIPKSNPLNIPSLAHIKDTDNKDNPSPQNHLTNAADSDSSDDDQIQNLPLLKPWL
jgi:hypothetical protein